MRYEAIAVFTVSVSQAPNTELPKQHSLLSIYGTFEGYPYFEMCTSCKDSVFSMESDICCLLYAMSVYTIISYRRRFGRSQLVAIVEVKVSELFTNSTSKVHFF
jgi:hypothetical protein